MSESRLPAIFDILPNLHNAELDSLHRKEYDIQRSFCGISLIKSCPNVFCHLEFQRIMCPRIFKFSRINNRVSS